MRPLAYISTQGNLYHNKEAAGGAAIPLIPVPLPLTKSRIVAAIRSLGRKPIDEQIDWSLIRAIERAHGIYEPEDI